MVMSVSDLNDLVRLLDEHPEWKAELRRRLLGEEFEELPQLTRRLANIVVKLQELVRENSERLAALEGRTEALEDLVRQNGERLTALENLVRQNGERLTALEDLVRQNGERLDRVDSRLDRVDSRLDRVDSRLDRVETRLGTVEGYSLELRYRDMIHSYLGTRLRKLRLLTLDDVPGLLNAYDAGKISPEQWAALTRVDAIVMGMPHRRGAATSILVALEVSATIDAHDIARAAEGAAILRGVGFTVVAAVGGNAIRPEDRRRAAESGVAVLLGGEIEGWPDVTAA